MQQTVGLHHNGLTCAVVVDYTFISYTGNSKLDSRHCACTPASVKSAL